MTPASVRRALSRAVDLRDYARKLYVEGALVFVGFRYGDPDLAALLDRVFGMFEPPRGTHYFLGAGVGPVTVDELMADHHIEVVILQGRGGDEVAERSIIEWLEQLRIECQQGGITLSQARPDADDVEGWIALLGDSGEEANASDALDQIERRARDTKEWETVIEVLLGRIEHIGDGRPRAELLRQLAEVYELGLGDLRRALFNRTYEHFMGHQHAPVGERLDAPALVMGDNVLYFAAPLFTGYRRQDYWAYRAIVSAALKQFLPAPMLQRAVPGWIETTLLRQPAAVDHPERQIVHLVGFHPRRTFQPILHVDQSWETANIRLSIAATTPPMRVYLAPENIAIPFTLENGRVIIDLPSIGTHTAVVIE